MLEKLKEHDIIDPKTDKVIGKIGCDLREIMDKLNELVDAVNTIQKEREAERFEIQEWIGILEAVRKSVNVHEKQIDELQATISKMENVERSENVQPVAETRSENVQPDYVTTSYVTTSYVTDGHTQEYYGQNGGSIVTDYPLPAGYIITIREPENKGGDNE